MPRLKTLVKICGVTTKQQAIQIAEFGADAIGIISVKESPRYISDERKKEIFQTLEDLFPKIERVSVVKNYPIDLIIKNFLDNPTETVIQLHGDEDIDYCKKLKHELPNIRIWKAFRIKTKNDLAKIKAYENFVDAILLDSWDEKTYGGSGKKIDLTYLKDFCFNKPWWLAGGISLNWAEQIPHAIRPTGFDISSSIEILPGMKDLKKTEQLIKYLK